MENYTAKKIIELLLQVLIWKKLKKHNDDQKKYVVWFHLYMISFIERTKIGKAKYYTLRDAYT